MEIGLFYSNWDMPQQARTSTELRPSFSNLSILLATAPPPRAPTSSSQTKLVPCSDFEISLNKLCKFEEAGQWVYRRPTATKNKNWINCYQIDSRVSCNLIMTVSNKKRPLQQACQHYRAVTSIRPL